MLDIILSVVTYNNPISMLDNLVQSTKKTAVNLKVVFIDNSNNPLIKEYCAKQNIDYLLSGGNVGFGKAHNMVMKEFAGKAKYFIVSNPDIVIHEGALENLTRFMDENQDVTLSVPLVLNPDGTIQHVHKRLPSPLVFFGRRFFPGSLKKLIQRKLDLYELQDQTFDHPIEVPSMSGCFMFFRYKSMIQVGGFDENYFMYVEDIDITRKSQSIGHTVIFPAAKVTHLWTRGSYFNFKLMWINIQSIYYYFTKWGPDDSCVIKEYPCRSR